MTYMKNGAMIRMVGDREVAHFAEMGFVPIVSGGVKPAKKPARKPREEKPHGGA